LEERAPAKVSPPAVWRASTPLVPIGDGMTLARKR
jgi:hypothetical protein